MKQKSNGNLSRKSRKELSIKQKVTLWYACMLVLIVLLLFGFIFAISRNILQRQSDSRLEEIVLEFADDIDFEQNSYELDDDIRFYENGVIFSLYDEQGRLTAGSVPTDFPADTILKAYSFQTISSSGNTWSVYDAALPYGDGQILWIRGILQSETLFSVERTMFLVLLIACPLLIAVALLVGYSITRRAFLPISEICRTAETIGAGGDLSARISTERTQGELRQMADTFNEMFQRLETSFEHERQFTSDASHELRTPIAVITSQAEYALLPDATAEEQREGLEVILEQARKMSSLISRLLLLARADNGTQQLSMAPLNLSYTAAEAAEQCRETALRHHITLSCEITPDIIAEGDQDSLTRVFLNLLENAIQYGRSDGFVKLFLEVQDDFAVCSICDNGIGIAPEDLSRIWLRFYRADPSRNPGGSNTGLGLSLVKWIVEAHHGSVSVSSVPGEGSRFTFRIPLRQPT